MGSVSSDVPQLHENTGKHVLAHTGGGDSPVVILLNGADEGVVPLIEEDRADWYHYRICVSRQPSSRRHAGLPKVTVERPGSGDDSSLLYTCSRPRRRRRMAHRNTSMNGRSRARLPTRMGCSDTGVARSQCHHVSGRAHPLYDDGEANLGRTGRAWGWRNRSTAAGWRENSRARQRGAYLAADLQIEWRRWHLGVSAPIAVGL